MSDDLCEVCRVAPATWLDNPPIGRWRVICDRCEVIHPFELFETAEAE